MPEVSPSLAEVQFKAPPKVEVKPPPQIEPPKNAPSLAQELFTQATGKDTVVTEASPAPAKALESPASKPVPETKSSPSPQESAQPDPLEGLSKQTFYERLGIPPTAKAETIRAAYRKLAREYHPDLNKDVNAAEIFKLINEANQALSDPEKRAHYDEALRMKQEDALRDAVNAERSNNPENRKADLGNQGWAEAVRSRLTEEEMANIRENTLNNIAEAELQFGRDMTIQERQLALGFSLAQESIPIIMANPRAVDVLNLFSEVNKDKDNKSPELVSLLIILLALLIMEIVNGVSGNENTEDLALIISSIIALGFAAALSNIVERNEKKPQPKPEPAGVSQAESAPTREAPQIAAPENSMQISHPQAETTPQIEAPASPSLAEQLFSQATGLETKTIPTPETVTPNAPQLEAPIAANSNDLSTILFAKINDQVATSPQPVPIPAQNPTSSAN